MNKTILLGSIVLLSLTSCKKQIDNLIADSTGAVKAANQYVLYTIAQGEQYSNKSGYVEVQYEELKFNVKFDSSAIYKTVSPSNQNDINKLFGFSDNNTQHHQFSARFGWRYSNNALRLFAYVYNNGEMTFKELGTVAIGTENTCSIKVAGSQYIFTLNGKIETMPRAATTAKAIGYKLYPYFGGDELAPQKITISIKELQASL
ncbi:MAG: hypothetical protein JWQ96_1397 [Segetibacter sp.]|jgi:hypothetical protein|nr:hypothetical protein [Segetibacter sp.]